MEHLIGQTLSVLMGLFAVMNPIANTPIFLGLTEDDSKDVRKQVAAKSVLTAFAIVAVFALLGRLIFSLFGITLPAFRIMGGILVALIGYQMMHGNQSAVHHPKDIDDKADLDAALSIAVTPLAIPILAGPGTIAATMSFAAAGGVADVVITIVTFAVVCLITYVFFVYSEALVRSIGKTGLSVVTRIMGLILGVIGVQMLIAGVSGAIASYH